MNCLYILVHGIVLKKLSPKKEYVACTKVFMFICILNTVVNVDNNGVSFNDLDIFCQEHSPEQHAKSWSCCSLFIKKLLTKEHDS